MVCNLEHWPWGDIVARSLGHVDYIEDDRMVNTRLSSNIISLLPKWSLFRFSEAITPSQTGGDAIGGWLRNLIPASR